MLEAERSSFLRASRRRTSPFLWPVFLIPSPLRCSLIQEVFRVHQLPPPTPLPQHSCFLNSKMDSEHGPEPLHPSLMKTVGFGNVCWEVKCTADLHWLQLVSGPLGTAGWLTCAGRSSRGHCHRQKEGTKTLDSSTCWGYKASQSRAAERSFQQVPARVLRVQE